jgi:hypothetical protein
MGRRNFQREMRERRIKKLFVIATEGAKTEPTYFKLFNRYGYAVAVKCIEGKDKSAPKHVLKSMRDHIEKNDLIEGDEAWLVVDTDNWREADLKALHAWSTSEPSYGLAVSNPCFEYWLLLHFEEAKGAPDANECLHRLRKHMPHYDKGNLDVVALEPGIADAVGRARMRDTPPVEDWPRNAGSTVYRLVERLLDALAVRV